MTRTRTALLCAATLLAAALPTGAVATAPSALAAPAATATAARSKECAVTPGRLRGQAARIAAIAREARQDLHLNAVILRVDSGRREVVTDALGPSMTDVPARPDMHFRSGSVAIAYMATVLLQLVDEGAVRLDDPISRWLPDFPHAREITLRMLGSSTSGLHDYVTDPKFLADLYAAPFKHWTPAELLSYPLSHPLWYRPGTNWSYSHANFVLLGAVLEKITGVRLDRLLQRRVMGPLGLRQTANSFTPAIPDPVLHAFTSDRGLYEESTFWNPSWTTAPGAVQTTDICDLAASARAIGTGALLSPKGFRTQLDPGTVGLGGPTSTCPASVCVHNTEAEHYGFGVIVLNTWIVQNPSFSGYAAIQAYLPAQGLSIAVATTKTPTTPAGNTAQDVASRIAAALAPAHPLPAG
ncbi:serine hydrolase domain-containing protein [Actinacidiphila rubida]|uniref:CubicO group peptidase, beta-lactamase class C family n=1 Tax=Actinacidiphila rubida TaxID=310780 RepID=A0A1H8LY08_9ACTN|nr:serine hydrolase domain-containing protein [Actinacidiphila rubida]SEO09997.1 CubicO group peptidase, beta-lactamase class C family [Actinacidiphila rubida]